MSEILHGWVNLAEIAHYAHAPLPWYAEFNNRDGGDDVPCVLIPLTDAALEALGKRLDEELAKAFYTESIHLDDLMRDALRAALTLPETPHE